MEFMGIYVYLCIYLGIYGGKYGYIWVYMGMYEGKYWYIWARPPETSLNGPFWGTDTFWPPTTSHIATGRC